MQGAAKLFKNSSPLYELNDPQKYLNVNLTSSTKKEEQEEEGRVLSIEPSRETDMKGIENGDRVLIIKGENLPISCSIYFNETLVKEVVDSNQSLQRKKIKILIPSLQKVLQDSLNNFSRAIKKKYQLHACYTEC